MISENGDESAVTIVVRNGARRITIIFEPEGDARPAANARSLDAPSGLADSFGSILSSDSAVDEVELDITYKIGGTAQAFFMTFTAPPCRVEFVNGKATVRLPRSDKYHYDWTLQSTAGKATIELTVMLGSKELKPKLKEEITNPLDGQGNGGYFRHPAA